MQIRTITSADHAQLAEIYRQGIATGNATFQTVSTDWEMWDKGHLEVCRLAVFEGEKMAGWAALSPVSSRCVYAGVAELSIYIAADYRGKGIGKLLLTKLVEDSENAGFWTLQAGIFPENTASIQLHKSCGFREIGYRERIGQMNGVWRNNIILERRSKIVGV
jgi:phosphinothricin acetyltransferase